MLNKSFIMQAVSGTLLGLLSVTSVGAQRRALNLTSQAQPASKVEFDVYLPLENPEQLDQLLTDQHTPGSANFHKWLTPQQFQSRFGPNPAVMSKAASTLAGLGFTVLSAHSHGLHVAGTAGTVRQAFGVNLWNAQAANGKQRLMTTQSMKVPASLRQYGALIPAFSSVTTKQVHSKAMRAEPDNRYSPVGPYWFTDIRQAYQFPSYQVLTGKGVNVAIVMSSDILDSDLSLYFGHEGVTPPTVIRKPVLGGPGEFDPNADVASEASLDVQQVGGMAPGATIQLYDVPDLSDQSLLAAYQNIVDDNVADIVSSSFGGSELYYTAAYNFGIDYTYLLRIYHEIFAQGNVQGITFIASSGDGGAYDAISLDLTQLVKGVESPASDPAVTGVGGTNLTTTFSVDDPDAYYLGENAVFDPLNPAVGALPNAIFGSGGGESTFFAKPAYQNLIDTGSTARAVPDVAMQMGGCPVTAVQPCLANRSSVIAAVGGSFTELIGTSVAAPEFAGLLALAEENLGARVGNVNYQLYTLSLMQASGQANVFHQGFTADNGGFQSPEGKTGYNMIVGNGSPIGINLIGLPNAAVAGTPGSPSN